MEIRSLQAVLLVSAIFHGIFNSLVAANKCLKGAATSSLCLKYDELTNAVMCMV